MLENVEIEMTEKEDVAPAATVPAAEASTAANKPTASAMRYLARPVLLVVLILVALAALIVGSVALSQDDDSGPAPTSGSAPTPLTYPLGTRPDIMSVTTTRREQLTKAILKMKATPSP